MTRADRITIHHRGSKRRQVILCHHIFRQDTAEWRRWRALVQRSLELRIKMDVLEFMQIFQKMYVFERMARGLPPG